MEYPVTCLHEDGLVQVVEDEFSLIAECPLCKLSVSAIKPVENFYVLDENISSIIIKNSKKEED